MKRLPPCLLLGLWLVASSAVADTAYVTDILRLGIHRASDTSDRAFDSLVSGTALEVLERTTNYARVRTPGGQEGWVKSAYLVADKPAQLRVAEVEAELVELREQLQEAQASRHRAEQEAVRLNAQLLDELQSEEAVQESLARLTRQNEEYEARFDRYRLSLPLSWVAGALALTLIAGIVAGWWGLDALIRRRHGGFRVY